MSVHPSSNADTNPFNQESSIDQLIEHITLTWRVSRNAIAQHAPSGSTEIINLELRIKHNPDSTQQRQWVLIDPKSNEEREIELPESGSTIEFTQTEIGLCLESPELRAHLRSIGSNSYELVYIHTDIFEQLKVKGGRYEPICVRVHH